MLVYLNSKRLSLVDRKLMLINAHRLVGKKYKNSPLWGFIVDVCGVGSTSATEIARECGWDADQNGSKQLRR